MDSAATQEAPELAVRCLLDNVQGLVDALSCIRWKKQQDAICELSEHGMVITVEEWTCLQARVYFRKEVLPTCFPWCFFICETLTLNPKPLTAWGCWSSTAFQRISISSRCAASIWGQLGSIDWLLAYIYFFHWHHCSGALLSRPWHAVASQVDRCKQFMHKRRDPDTYSREHTSRIHHWWWRQPSYFICC